MRNRSLLERLFEAVLWRSRYMVVVAVIASVMAAIAIFYVTTVDVAYLFVHALGYGQGALDAAARRALRDDTVTHVVEVVDGYLLGTVMLIFALGLYELFISDIDQARGSRASSRILVIETLDDLKTRLAKVIMMILIVKLFEHAVKANIRSALDLLYLGGGIALVGLALYLTHASESRAANGGEPRPAPPATSLDDG